MKVIPVPVRQDNYAYLLVDEPSNKAAAVDPFDVPRVAAAAERLGVSIIAAITTHHHNDHSGGNGVCVRPLNPLASNIELTIRFFFFLKKKDFVRNLTSNP